MTARPAVLVLGCAALGAGVFHLVSASLPPPGLWAAGIGATAVFALNQALLRDLRPRERMSIAAGASVLGFLVGSVGAVGPSPWALSFAATWAPALLFFVAGFGRERHAFELSHLEEEADDPARRPHVIARGTAIRDDARAAAKRLDPEATGTPAHPGDPRGVYAYAAQVVAYAHALDGRHDEAIASLGAVPIAWMPEAMRPLMLSNLAFWQLCLGAVDEAAATIAKAPDEDAIPEARPILRATRAAVLLRRGDPDGALALVGRCEGDAGEPSAVRPRYGIVRALALAAKGDAAAARDELERVAIEPKGAGELARWLPAGGDARDLLESVLSGERARAA